MKRIAALCFAGGLEVQVVYIPTEFNPADYPSRGLRVPGRRAPAAPAPKCPSCGLRPSEHPAHVPRRLRGTGLPCRQHGKLSYGFFNGAWESNVDLRMRDCIARRDLDESDSEYLEAIRRTGLLDHLDWTTGCFTSGGGHGCL